MSLIDSHLHVWDPSRHRHEWLDGEDALNRAFLPSDINFDSAGVTGVVFVQADASADQSITEAVWVASLASEWPQLRGIVAHAPLETEGLSATLDALEQIPLVVGVRRLLQDASDELFTAGALTSGLIELGRRGLAFDACVRHHQLSHLVTLVEAAPETTVVLDHLGKPPVAAGIDSAEGQEWLRQLHRLAPFERVALKLSGLAPEASPERALSPQSRPFLLAALEAFGAERCMVGSDWPVSTHTPHAMGYAEWFSLVLDGFGLSSEEAESVAHRTASRVYGI